MGAQTQVHVRATVRVYYRGKEKVIMGLPLLKVRYTVEEYLALERASEERHEYLDGDVYAMAGESPEHGAICMNLVRESLAPVTRHTVSGIRQRYEGA